MIKQMKFESQIEEKLSRLLKGRVKKNALKFVKYLNDNQMQPEQWWDSTTWRIPYGEYYLFAIGADRNLWVLTFFMGDYKGEFDGEFAKAIHSHVNVCASCHGDDTKVCPRGKDMTIFGKEFKNACIQFTIRFENPDENEFDSIKKLIGHYKNVVAYSESFHAH